MKVVKTKAEASVPVQVRMPNTIYKALKRSCPRGVSLQKLILAILERAIEDDKLVIEVTKR